MLFTLGGFSIWSLVDFCTLVFGNFKDSLDCPLVKKTATITVFGAILFIFQIIFIIGIVAGISIPQYARYRRGAQDNATQSAYHAVALSQEAYFVEYGEYADSYEELRKKSFVFDQNIEYSQINARGGCFNFRVKHKAAGSTTYDFDSCREQTVKAYMGN